MMAQLLHRRENTPATQHPLPETDPATVLPVPDSIRMYENEVQGPLSSPVYDIPSPLFRDEFMHSPLSAHSMPRPLYNSLLFLGDNLHEILENYGEKELLKIKWFGKTRLHMLKSFLQEHDRSSLLHS
jgi:hypothetical protein